MRLSLRGWLLILAVVALVPAAVLLGWTELQLRRARTAEIDELALRYGQLASLELDRIVGGVETLLLAVGHARSVNTLAAGACDAYLARIVPDAPALAALAALDGDGVARCASRQPLPALSPANRDIVAAARGRGRPAIGLFQAGPLAGRPVLPIALPLRDADAAAGAALVAYLDLDWLRDRLRERGLGAGNSLTVSDSAGVIVAREPFSSQFVGTRIPVAFDRLIHAAAPGTEEVISQDGTRRVLGYYPVTVPPFGLYVSAGISEAEAFQTIDAARRRDRAVMALVGLLLAALVWAAGQRFIQRPVERLLACIAAWRRGDYAVRTGMIAESGELAAVGAAFDSLIEDLVQRQAASERAEAQRQLLVGELTHRVKNTLALVQAIAVQSLRGADMAAAREVFQSRLRALAEAHDVLTAHSWEAAALRDVLDRTLLPYRDGWPGRFALSGPALRLQPRAALAVALSVHELATNAVKYGALSVEAGQVRIAWRIDGEGAAARFRFIWTEAGGPPVTAPSHAGFGSRMIRTALGAELGGSAEMAFAPTGLICSLDAPLTAVVADPAAQADEVAAED